MGTRSQMYKELSRTMEEINDLYAKCNERIAYFNNEYKDFFEEYKKPSSNRKKGIYDHMKAASSKMTESFDKIDLLIPYILAMCTIFRNFLSEKAAEHKKDPKKMEQIAEQKNFVDDSTAELNRMQGNIAMARPTVASTLLFCEANA